MATTAVHAVTFAPWGLRPAPSPHPSVRRLLVQGRDSVAGFRHKLGLLLIGVITAFITSFYMFRLMYMNSAASIAVVRPIKS